MNAIPMVSQGVPSNLVVISRDDDLFKQEQKSHECLS